MINEVNKTGGLALSSAGFIYMKGEDPVHYLIPLIPLIYDIMCDVMDVSRML